MKSPQERSKGSGACFSLIDHQSKSPCPISISDMSILSSSNSSGCPTLISMPQSPHPWTCTPMESRQSCFNMPPMQSNCSGGWFSPYYQFGCQSFRTPPPMYRSQSIPPFVPYVYQPQSSASHCPSLSMQTQFVLYDLYLGICVHVKDVGIANGSIPNPPYDCSSSS